MLRIDDTFFVLIDVQDKLARAMHDRERLLDNCRRALACMQALGVPVVWSEQVPEKLGPTLPELAALLPGATPIRKHTFSCCGEAAFNAAVEALKRSRAIVAGIEAHVCVYQTAADLFARGYHVELLADAVSSRTPGNRTIGLDRARSAGCSVSSVETAVFELLRTSEHPAFRDVSRILK